MMMMMIIIIIIWCSFQYPSMKNQDSHIYKITGTLRVSCF